MASASGNEARWNAFRSQKRSAIYIPPFAPWMVTALQAIKFSIFVALHVFLFGGAAFSKLIVIILATNLNAPSQNALSSKYSQTCPVSVSHTPRVHAAVHVALFLIQALPDLFSVLQCIYRLLSIGRGQGGVNVTLIILECCRGAGLSAIFMLVFPQLDVMRALFLLSCLPLIPMAQRLMVSMMRSLQPDRSLAKRLILTLGTVPHFFLVLLLLSGCYVWSLLDTPFDNVIVLPIAVILASLGFWESWITVGHAGSFFHHLYQVKYGIRKLNAPTRLVIALLRLGIYVCVFSMAAGRSSIEMGHVGTTLTHWNFDLKHTRLLSLALAVCALNIALRGSSHLLAALDLRALPALQPLFIVPPFLLCCFVVLCHISPDCWLAAEIAKFGLSFRCTQWPREPLPVADTYLCCVWLLIGMYKAYQLACNPEFDKCDEVIHSMSPVLNGLCVDQGLIVFHFALSKNDDKRLKLDFNSVFDDGIGKPEGLRSEADRIANVYVCATMWHETENEMRQMFSSILKLDEERAHIMTRRSVASDSTKFRLEAHIFFDDAWEDQAELGRAPNDFFRTFFALVNSMIDGKEDINGSGPTKILVNTAYGGRLVIRLPAGTLLFVHLKDKKMIRHKKRWSQVMYMYYLLGHRIMESHMSVEDKQVIADNTYILAIDGDSKFEPEAFLRLLNLMNTKADIGCACGRIHPIGQGVMVWYQKFEYAIAHWFQKAAEHVFGCVLCAPGCFSLFRAAALMDDNIMHKYTTTAVEPRHYVQYDQGEDRWLSTLLLKQGYRIEYAAASDAETYAPEGFDEFFNQRRRWTPSSVANTIDLLADYKRACANNACISRLYILYQFSVIGFSMLGPAIIFSMLVYAQVAAFHIDMNRIMLYNALPIATFVVVCFTMESNIQLLFAKVLSIIYAFVMLAVIVATCSQVILETMFSPTSMFVVSMIAIFFFAACCHPREFSNIIYGTIFFLMIPATYVVMAFYSLINLNVINWGTREAVAKATGQEQKSESLLDKFVSRVAGSSLSGLLPNRGSKTDPKIEELEKKLLEMEHRLVEDVPEKETAGVSEQKKERDENGDDLFNASGMEVRTGTRDLWMDAEYLQVCEKGRLKAGEQQFWDQLIDTYLKPIQTTPAENRAAADGLRELRNNIAFTVLLLNALMVLAIYLTQNHKDVLAFSWMPHENFKQFRWNSTVQEWTKESIPLKVEMLGLSIIFALFGILLVQTIGLIMHRLNTMVGAFQEVDALGDFVTPAATKRDDDNDIMEIARAMLDTCHYWRGHGSSGYMREASAGSASVLQRLQRARIETAIRNNALRNPK